MSVEVKTPTKSPFQHQGFPCGELTSPGDGSKHDEVSSRRCISFVEEKDDEKIRKNKGDRPKDFYFRKRRFSQQQKSGEQNQVSFQGGLKRKRLGSKSGERPKIILPTKFLLGGNINDPLNLNSLYHDDIGRVLNERTPQSSPIPIASHRQNVEVVIPPNITDPLNLNAEDGDSGPGKMGAKKRKRSCRHKRKESTTHSTPIGKEAAPEKKKELLEALKIEIDSSSEITEEFEEKTSDKIVSPVIPQASPKSRRRRRTISECRSDPSSETSRILFRSSSSPIPEPPRITPPKKFRRQFSCPKSLSISKPQTEAVKFVSNSKFVYGNYNRYYGYRNPGSEIDHRITSFDSDWFECKDVLDIGCNVGHLTLAIARDFHPRKIIGIDIDPELIKSARRNLRNFISTHSADILKYPVSNSVNYGPIAAPTVGRKKELPSFPNNLLFIQGNIVLDNDELLEFQQEEYDMVLALSITKWIHLNWGDSGLKRVFRRIFKQLRPGGKLILEPQAWVSYKKRKKLSENIYINYQNIKLRPEQFRHFLLSEVGFSKCEVISVPFNKSKGFRRPLQLYTKADTIGNTPDFVEMEDMTKLNRSLDDQTSCKISGKPNSFECVTTAEVVKEASPGLGSCAKDISGVIYSPDNVKTSSTTNITTCNVESTKSMPKC